MLCAGHCPSPWNLAMEYFPASGVCCHSHHAGVWSLTRYLKSLLVGMGTQIASPTLVILGRGGGNSFTYALAVGDLGSQPGTLALLLPVLTLWRPQQLCRCPSSQVRISLPCFPSLVEGTPCDKVLQLLQMAFTSPNLQEPHPSTAVSTGTGHGASPLSLPMMSTWIEIPRMFRVGTAAAPSDRAMTLAPWVAATASWATSTTPLHKLPTVLLSRDHCTLSCSIQAKCCSRRHDGFSRSYNSCPYHSTSCSCPVGSSATHPSSWGCRVRHHNYWSHTQSVECRPS